MVDYTTSKSGSGSGIGLLIAAGIVLLILLYALYAGSGPATSVPNDLTAPAATETAPAVLDETVPPSE